MTKQYLLALLGLTIISHEAYSAIMNNVQKRHYLKEKFPKISRSSSGDAEILYDAIESSDNNAIMNLLAKRTLAERLEISEYYNYFYDQDLLEDLKDELSGDFENLIVAMMTPTTKYYGGEIWNAVVGLGSDEKSLTEILITLNNQQIKESGQFYYEAHQETLEEAIIDDTSGFFKDFLVSLSHADRDEHQIVDEIDAINDADALYASNNTRFETFNDIFSHRSYSQLNLIFEEYRYYYGETIETTIENNFSGDIADGLLALAKKVQNEPAYFAQRFYESMAGWGTSDSVLIRLAVTRSEIDIEDIKTEYRDRYSNTLADDIIDETSGDYQKCLLILIGEEDALKLTENAKQAEYVNQTKSP